MIEATDIFVHLMQSGELEDIADEKAMSACRRAMDWIKGRLRDCISEDDERIITAAAAMARFYLFTSMIGEEVNFKAGDITVRSSISQQMDAQMKILELSLAQAADILEDGGFCFVSG